MNAQAIEAAPSSVSFTEEMKGWVGFGEPDYARGRGQGEAEDTPLMIHLTIEASDIERFIADPRHEATATGWVHCEALGGKLPVSSGAFNLFVESGDGQERRMLYRLYFQDAVGHELTLSGHKVIRAQGGRMWSDTSTLYTRVLSGHVETEQEAGAGVVASGILRIHKLDFARQLTTFRGKGASPGAGASALRDFNRLFLGELWRTYGYALPLTIAGVLAAGAGAGVAGAGGFKLVRMLRRGRAVQPGPSRESWRRWASRILLASSASTVAILMGAEGMRVWRLGTLPLKRTDAPVAERISPLAVIRILREGYQVSSTRENTIFNVLSSFIVTFAATRTITVVIRERGRLGPIRNLSAGGRHIHHFIPGAIISFLAGGVAVAQGRDSIDRWLAIPFGMGTALVLDETALLLELDDVYWTEEGILSVETAFATMALLAAIAYAKQVRSRGTHTTEADWIAAANAWDTLDVLHRGRDWQQRPADVDTSAPNPGSR